jgi:hypothetical protein
VLYPVWKFMVAPRACTGAPEVPDPYTGECKCPPEAIYATGICWRVNTLVPLVVLLPLFGLVVIAAAVFQRMRGMGRDSLWNIDLNRLLILEPAVVLGYGTFGQVVKGEIYRV